MSSAPGRDELQREPDADPESVARTICLTQLTAAPRTRAQLADVLARRNVPDQVAAAVLSRLDEVGLIDDAAYARAWVGTRHAGRGLSRLALARELRQRGVAEEVVAQAVGRVDADQELQTARELARRRARSTRHLPDDVRLRRLVGVLGRRGYPAPLALRAAREALATSESASDEPPPAAGRLDPSVTRA